MEEERTEQEKEHDVLLVINIVTSIDKKRLKVVLVSVHRRSMEHIADYMAAGYHSHTAGEESPIPEKKDLNSFAVNFRTINGEEVVNCYVKCTC